MEIKDNEIIIIGNGSSILNYEFGDVINNFKEVVRINDFEIEGYEKYIGTKTTIWGRSNSNRTKNRLIDDSISVVIASPHWNYKNVKDKMRLYKKSSCVSMKDSWYLQEDLGLMGRCRSASRRRGWPSTGLLIIYYFLKKYKTIYIHGFDFFKDDKGDSRHYYNNKELMRVQTSRNHNGEKEKKWVMKKVKEKRIKILREIIVEKYNKK